MQKLIKNSKIILAGAILSVVFSYGFLVKSAPPANPPGGDKAQPINIGSDPQAKDGRLTLGTNSIFGNLGSVALAVGGTSGSLATDSLFVDDNARTLTKLSVLNSSTSISTTSVAKVLVDGQIRSSILDLAHQAIAGTNTVCADPSGIYVLCTPTIPTEPQEPPESPIGLCPEGQIGIPPSCTCPAGQVMSDDGICEVQLYTYTLTINKTGTGAFNVVNSITSFTNNTLINELCGLSCSSDSFYYTGGTTVYLNPNYGGDTIFTGWTCAGTGCGSGANSCTSANTRTDKSCQVTINSNTTVTASFAPFVLPAALAVEKTGTGTGTVKTTATLGGSTFPANQINCGSLCDKDYTFDTTTYLKATPSSDSIFTGWTCAGNTANGGLGCGVNSNYYLNSCTSVNTRTDRSCQVKIYADTTVVTANFNQLPPKELKIMEVDTSQPPSTSAVIGIVTASVNPLSPGFVAVSPWVNVKSGDYTQGTSVTLTANPPSGYNFVGWTTYEAWSDPDTETGDLVYGVDGACTTTAPCTIVMSTDKFIVAEFVSTSTSFCTVWKTGFSSGTHTFTAPSTLIGDITVELWGAGAAGAAGGSGGGSGGGGGGAGGNSGQYKSFYKTVTPGVSYNVVTGAGGTPMSHGSSTCWNSSSPGGSTTGFNETAYGGMYGACGDPGGTLTNSFVGGFGSHHFGCYVNGAQQNLSPNCTNGSDGITATFARGGDGGAGASSSLGLGSGGSKGDGKENGTGVTGGNGGLAAGGGGGGGSENVDTNRITGGDGGSGGNGYGKVSYCYTVPTNTVCNTLPGYTGYTGTYPSCDPPTPPTLTINFSVGASGITIYTDSASLDGIPVNPSNSVGIFACSYPGGNSGYCKATYPYGTKVLLRRGTGGSFSTNAINWDTTTNVNQCDQYGGVHSDQCLVNLTVDKTITIKNQ